MVQSWGMDSEVADSGAAALARLHAGAAAGNLPRLLLVDDRMPEITSRVLANPSAHGRLTLSPILMLTASDRTARVGNCEELAVGAYLAKPIRPSELLLAIRKVLGTTPVTNSTVVPFSEPVTGPSLRILVAEDNVINQKLASALLQKLGHQVILAENGRTALEILAEQPFDLALMDVQMPVMDGLEATRELRLREKALGRLRLPVVAVTARAMAGDHQRCLEAGMDDYVSKPLRPQALQEAIERVFASVTN